MTTYPRQAPTGRPRPGARICVNCHHWIPGEDGEGRCWIERGNPLAGLITSYDDSCEEHLPKMRLTAN